jgi:hypothetical protein
MLDAASAQEGETARALGMMDRLMRAMCMAEADRGVAKAAGRNETRQVQMSVAGFSDPFEDDELTLDDAIAAVKTITVTTVGAVHFNPC